MSPIAGSDLQCVCQVLLTHAGQTGRGVGDAAGPVCTPEAAQWVVQGLATLVTMAPPVAFSLLLLARLEASAGARWGALQAARDTVLQQCGLLDEGSPLTVPVSALAVRARTRAHHPAEGRVTPPHGRDGCRQPGAGHGDA